MLAAVAAAVVLAGAAAVVPGKNGRIAFTSNRDDPTADLRGNFEIYSMNPDGSGVARLTNNAPGIDGTPVWSPDGKKIVFSSDRDSGQTALFHLYSMNADGSGVARLLTGDAADLEGDWQALAAPTASQAVAAVRKYWPRTPGPASSSSGSWLRSPAPAAFA